MRLLKEWKSEMIHTFEVRTSTQNEFIDITRFVQEAAQKTGVEDGICIT